MISETVNTGIEQVTLLQNQYKAGDAVSLWYRHAANGLDCESAEWISYGGGFASLGYVQVKLVSTL